MAKFKIAKSTKISADEARGRLEKRGLTLRDTSRGTAVMKAARGRSWDKEARTARFVMTTEEEIHQAFYDYRTGNFARDSFTTLTE